MRLGLIYGGISVEHEISIITAMQIYEELISSYDVMNVYYAKNGKFYIGDNLSKLDNYKNLDEVVSKSIEVHFERIGNQVYVVENKLFGKKHQIDLAFLAMHGAMGEDGRLQGFLDVIGLEYTGPSHYGSVIGQDKTFTKDILKANNFNVVDYINISDAMSVDEIKAQVKSLTYPVVLKPATLGSSVGIGFCDSEDELEAALNEAFKYDTKVVIENKISDFLEVNCSILGSYKNAKASVLEEILCEDFLSFESKYMSGSKSKGMASTGRHIPARINEELTLKAQKMCLDAFKKLNLSGVVRFDLMIYNDDVYINEVNTIPGSLAYYLWDYSGVSKLDLYKELINLAIEKKRIKASKISSYDTNVLEKGNFKGKKGK
ncbi:MAG: D-alanine--D-alanine ligase [Bacilli bacterium]